MLKNYFNCMYELTKKRNKEAECQTLRDCYITQAQIKSQISH